MSRTQLLQNNVNSPFSSLYEKERGLKSSTRYNNSELVSRLASARTTTEIDVVISKCYQSLSSLTAALTADNADSANIRKCIAHVKKIIQAAQKKRQHVESEKKTEQELQSAERQNKEKEHIQQLRDSLKTKRKRNLREEKRDIQKLRQSCPSDSSAPLTAFSSPPVSQASCSPGAASPSFETGAPALSSIDVIV